MKTYSRGERGDEPLERKDDTVLGQRNWVGEAEGVGGGAGMIDQRGARHKEARPWPVARDGQINQSFLP